MTGILEGKLITIIVTLLLMEAMLLRFSLILSKTINLEVDLDDGVYIEDIDEIACKNEDGSFVYGEDGKLQIQTDGTGFISADLAQRCPVNCFKGSSANDANFEGVDHFKKIKYADGITCGELFSGN